MNLFATIIPFDEYKKVKFYTLKCEDHALSETHKFYANAINWGKYIDEVERLTAWLGDIGDNRGAIKDLFRWERKARALPPPAEHMTTKKIYVKDVRLYCHWVNERVVVLFNGGVKTKLHPQDCPNVSDHFYNAVNWSGKLNGNLKIEGKEIKNISEIKIKY